MSKAILYHFLLIIPALFSLQARLISADCQRAAASAAWEAEHEQHKQAFTIALRILWTNITECVLKTAKQLPTASSTLETVLRKLGHIAPPPPPQKKSIAWEMPKFIFLYFSPRKKTMQTVTKSETFQTQVYQGKKIQIFPWKQWHLTCKSISVPQRSCESLSLLCNYYMPSLIRPPPATHPLIYWVRPFNHNVRLAIKDIQATEQN